MGCERESDRVGVEAASCKVDFCIQNGANHRHHGVRLFTCLVNLSLIKRRGKKKDAMMSSIFKLIEFTVIINKH